MKKFRDFFLWSMNMKLYMGIYFSAVIFLAGFMYFVQGKYEMTFMTIFTGIMASLVVALLQVTMLDDRCDYSKGILFTKSLSWLAICTIIFGGTAYAFKWFEGLPNINYPIFIITMAIGLFFMLLGEKYEQEATTEKLNSALKNYKRK
ncbi:MAG: hypothetical protein ACK5L6_10815 [Anaerorhabdus sp.]|uniref:hypothetical protein n=1 Tax=Anaerorhabdus sp. TaxID=1872524 RepID=UPI003A86EC39